MPSGKIQTEIEVLRSRQLTEYVVRLLHLEAAIGPSPEARRAVQVLSVPADVSDGDFGLTKNNDGSFILKDEGDSPRKNVPATVRVGTPFTAGGASLVLTPDASRAPNEITVRFQSFHSAVDGIRSRLTVSRPNRDAQIVVVRYEDPDPAVAAAVPNFLLEEFIRYKASTNRTEATSTVGFLRDQVASYDKQLKGAEGALGGFREQEHVVSIGDEASAQVKRMAALQAERDQLQGERDALASTLRGATGGGNAKDIAAFPSFIANRGMQDILQNLAKLEDDRAQLLVRRNPENADVVALTERINALNSQMVQTAQAYLNGLNSKLLSLNTSMKSFGAEIEKIPAREIEFARLLRQQTILEQISTLLQTRLKEAEIKEAVQPGDVRVIDRALIPGGPSSPKPVKNLVFGTILGVFAGLTAALIREMMDKKIRTKEDVQSVTGGLPILGAIPRLVPMAVPRLAHENGNGSENGKKKLAKPSGPANGRALIPLKPSHDVSAEAYRALRTNITFAAADHANQVLVLTSALPGDGKSTSSANLAVTLAQQGVRTLLVDADLRKGVLHSFFECQREPGLTQVLIGEKTLAEAIQPVSLGGTTDTLFLLTAGRFPPNPAELLGSERMSALVEEMRQAFQMIVFDTPPLTVVTDAAVLGTLADSTVLVARAGTTDKRALHHAAAQLYHLRVHVSGTIVNDFDPKQSGYGYEYGYGYAPGYSKYGGAAYGHTP
ncbi:MAG: polysaccharide biosynthesis tyrosine autokinase [Gemmatimonadaceae bacterium]|nr:polysaccharide biosynthesis tyrosine autokinase [Gemmatimonadaceae bacterium]